MQFNLSVRRRLAGALLPLLGLAVTPALAPNATAVRAQTSTASLRGHVYGPGRVPVSDAQVQLTDPASGVQRGATTNASGFYNVSAVPPGSYTMRVRRIGFSPAEHTVRLQVGETGTLDVDLSEAATQLSTVQVTAAAPTVSLRTSEVGTNVSTEQIENLPQANRNFLDFATLAPGVQPRGAGISAGGASVNNSNLFIDGASFKSDVLPGGVAGQDPSLARSVPGVGNIRGNPFPQNAVQEFRVLTQNYKAEYQKASGAVVTAATKSGTNELHGDLFYQGQVENFIARNAFQTLNNLDVPNYSHSQFGGSLGGPIIKDRLHYFASYEGNLQQTDTRFFPRLPAGVTVADSVRAGGGLYTQPFTSHLGFGKLTYQMSDRSDLMFSANVRRERDAKRDIGGNTGPEAAAAVDNNVYNYQLRHTYSAQPFTNEAQVSYQRFSWKDNPVNGSNPRVIYRLPGSGLPDLIRGGNNAYQTFHQDRISLRNDLTWTASSHVVKGGANLDFLRYDVNKLLEENPTFFFATDAPGGLQTPYEADVQVGDPRLKTSNRQFGAYIQDDWTVVPRLTLNLGVRWDYESNWLNNDFVTPSKYADSARAYSRQYGFFNAEDYISTGSNRKNFYGAFQPRLGFSYDVTGNNSTVVFGGGGLFYDRFNYNTLLDEKYKVQRPRYQFRFVPPGTTPGPNETVFNPSYYSKSGLLAAAGTSGNPEVFLINNHQKPPYTVQYSAGVRHVFGAYTGSVTGTLVNGFNNFKWIWGNRNPADNSLHFGEHGIGALIISTDNERTWYRGLLFNLSKPFVGGSRWGGDLSYTLSKTESSDYQDVEDNFAFDYIPGDPYFGFKRIPGRYDERHRVVLNLMTRIPFGVRLSTITTLGSGNPYTLTTGCTSPTPAAGSYCASQPVPPAYIPDFLANPPGQTPRSAYPQGQWFGPFGKWAYRNVDVRLQKDFSIGAQTVGVSLDALNVFNFQNYNYAGANFVYNVSPTSTQVRHPGGEFDLYNSRRIQLGARYGF